MRGDDEAIAVFERQIGDAVDVSTVGFDFENDASERHGTAEAGYGLPRFDGVGVGGSGVAVIDRALIAVGEGGGDLGFERIGVLVEALLLDAARGEARKLGAVKVSVRGEAAGACEEMAERFAGCHAIDAGRCKLPFEADEAGLLHRRNLEVGGGEEGDDIADEQF